MNDLSEKEQVEAIRNWWDENGKFIIAGIILGAGGLIGWNQWQAHQARQAEAASVVYEKLLAAVEKGNEFDAVAAAATLEQDYGSTPYALQADLAMAKLYMDQGEPAEAEARLRELLAGAESPLSLIARQRLARVLLYQDKPAEALEVLAIEDAASFRARFLELEGDAQMALGNREAARDAYNRALAEAGEQPLVDTRLLRMKLDDLGSVETVADAGTEGEAP